MTTSVDVFTEPISGACPAPTALFGAGGVARGLHRAGALHAVILLLPLLLPLGLFPLAMVDAGAAGRSAWYALVLLALPFAYLRAAFNPQPAMPEYSPGRALVVVGLLALAGTMIVGAVTSGNAALGEPRWVLAVEPFLAYAAFLATVLLLARALTERADSRFPWIMATGATVAAGLCWWFGRSLDLDTREAAGTFFLVAMHLGAGGALAPGAQPRRRVAPLLTFGAGIGGLVFTRSPAVLFVALFSAGLFVALRFGVRARSRVALALMTLALAAVALPVLRTQQSDAGANIAGVDARARRELNARALLWRRVSARARQDSFLFLAGRGAGSLSADLPDIAGAPYFVLPGADQEVMEPRSALLSGLYDFGVFGLVLAGLAVVFVFRAGCNRLAFADQSARSRLCGGLGAVFAALCLFALTGAGASAMGAVAAALALGVFTGAARRLDNPASPELSVVLACHRGKNDTLTSCVGFAGLVVVCGALAWGIAWRVVARGSMLVRQADLAIAAGSARESAALAPRLSAWLGGVAVRGQSAAAVNERLLRLSGAPRPSFDFRLPAGRGIGSLRAVTPLVDYGDIPAYTGRVYVAVRQKPQRVEFLRAMEARLLWSRRALESRPGTLTTASEDLEILAQGALLAMRARPRDPSYPLFVLATRVMVQRMGLRAVRLPGIREAQEQYARAWANASPRRRARAARELKRLRAHWGDHALFDMAARAAGE